tara:strand:+ start:1827 stop:2030 length:204 start_codon:yes stop_codon:yes gene_type:complete
MTIEVDGKIFDEKNLSKEARIALENVNQLNKARDTLVLNLERNRILLSHYTNMVKKDVLKEKKEDKK